MNIGLFLLLIIKQILHRLAHLHRLVRLQGFSHLHRLAHLTRSGYLQVRGHMHGLCSLSLDIGYWILAHVRHWLAPNTILQVFWGAL